MLWSPLQSQSPLEGETPLSPRSLRRWLKTLPWLVKGETARLVYEGLLELNQKTLAPLQRMQLMELMRNHTQPVLNHLSNQLADRPLPLSPRGRKVLHLLLSLHKELAAGFRLVLTDAVNEDLMGTKPLAIATHRALRHLSLIHLHSAKLYETEPSGMWQGIHWLYGFAESHHLTTTLVKDPAYPRFRQSSITEVYLQILLLALSIPSTLREGEAECLSQFFEINTALASIKTDIPFDMNQGSYLINLDLDRPPTYSTESLDFLPHCRILKLELLLTHLREKLQGSSSSPSEKVRPGNNLPPNLARKLLIKLTNHPKRDFARSLQIESIYVAIGLDPVYRAIQVDKERLGFQDRPHHSRNGHENTASAPLTNSSLILPRNNEGVHNDYDSNATHEDVWRLVESALQYVEDVLWDQEFHALELESLGSDYRPCKELEHDPPIEWSEWELKSLENDHKPRKELGYDSPIEWTEWELQNVSPGGFCIRWHQDGTAHAHVSEIVALREREGHNNIWKIGIIRWLRNLKGHGLLAGIQLIASRCHLITVYHAKPPQKGSPIAIDGLLLPENEALNQPGSLILPAKHFQAGDEIILTEGTNTNRVRLVERLQYSMSFSQFLITPMDT